jgi:hypothetical protein
MQIPVLIKPVAGNGFLAQTGEPLPLRAEGATEEEAVAKLGQELTAQLSNGSKLVTLEVQPGPNPLMKFAAMFKDNPYFDEVIEIMKENRRLMDLDPEVP